MLLLHLCLAALPLLSSPALSPSRPQLSEAAARADLVISAEVLSTSSRWSRNGRHLVTEVELEVHESTRGAAPLRVTVLCPGGQLGDIVQRVSHTETFVAHEQVVLFLERLPHGRYQLLPEAPALRVRGDEVSDGQRVESVVGLMARLRAAEATR